MTNQTLAKNENTQQQSLNRAEWMGAISLGLSFLTIAYMAGVQVQEISDLNRRTTAVEAVQSSNVAKIETLLVTTARIDANVSAIAEQARERRDRGNR